MRRVFVTQTHCRRSYIISMAVADMTDEIWLQGFNDAGNTVLGRTANELTELRERDESAFMLQMSSASGKSYIFTVRAKQDTYNVSHHDTRLFVMRDFEANVGHRRIALGFGTESSGSSRSTMSRGSTTT